MEKPPDETPGGIAVDFDPPYAGPPGKALAASPAGVTVKEYGRRRRLVRG
jgi:hypothetical protein